MCSFIRSFVRSFVQSLVRALVQSVRKLSRGSARRNSRRKRTHFEVGRNLACRVRSGGECAASRARAVRACVVKQQGWTREVLGAGCPGKGRENWATGHCG